jgi:hypothetical protein
MMIDDLIEFVERLDGAAYYEASYVTDHGVSPSVLQGLIISLKNSAGSRLEFVSGDALLLALTDAFEIPGPFDDWDDMKSQICRHLEAVDY